MYSINKPGKQGKEAAVSGRSGLSCPDKTIDFVPGNDFYVVLKFYRDIYVVVESYRDLHVVVGSHRERHWTVLHAWFLCTVNSFALNIRSVLQLIRQHRQIGPVPSGQDH